MAHRLRSKINQYSRLASTGHLGPVIADLRRWIWSTDDAVGLARDLTVPLVPPPALVPLEIRPLDETTAKSLFSEKGLDNRAAIDMESRRRFWDDGLPGAFVAIDDHGTPCYVQWAISGAHSRLVRDYFGKGFPELASDDLLLEGAWARPEARGKRIMAEAMSRITEAGAGEDHRRAITFVGVNNEPSIRGCRSAGYEVYISRRETWRFGVRTVSWGEPDGPTPSRSGLPPRPSPDVQPS